LSKIFGHCLFANLDPGFCKGKPILYDLNKVVIHIREGDFLENKCALGCEYYKSAVRIAIDRSEEKSGFIVVTDDTSWSKKNNGQSS